MESYPTTGCLVCRDPGPATQPHPSKKREEKKVLVRYPLLSGFFGLLVVSKREPAPVKFNPMFDMCITV